MYRCYWIYNLEKITFSKLLLYIHFFQGRSLISSITTSFGFLRCWRAQDAQILVKYANNRNVSINMRDGFSYPYTLRNAKTFLETVSKQNPVTFYAIATSEEAIGGIGVSINTDVHRLTAELGYWLAEPYWGKGIMTEAVSTFTEYAFAHFGLIRFMPNLMRTIPDPAEYYRKRGSCWKPEWKRMSSRMVKFLINFYMQKSKRNNIFICATLNLGQELK